MIEGFYKGMMYEDIDKELGEAGMNVMRTYWDMPKGSNQRRQYRRQHPEIKKYYDIKDSWMEVINRRVIEIGSLFEKGVEPEIRETNLSFNQQKMVESMSSREPEELSAIEWQSTVGQDFEDIKAWLFDKKKIPFDVEQRLIEIAEGMDISLDRLLQLIGISLQ
jgi:hypothetical protein